MIKHHTKITIDEINYRLVPEEVYLRLIALARQVRDKKRIINHCVIDARVEKEHVELAQSALTMLSPEEE